MLYAVELQVIRTFDTIGFYKHQQTSEFWGYAWLCDEFWIHNEVFFLQLVKFVNIMGIFPFCMLLGCVSDKSRLFKCICVIAYASICNIHQFCQLILQYNGFATIVFYLASDCCVGENLFKFTFLCQLIDSVGDLYKRTHYQQIKYCHQ